LVFFKRIANTKSVGSIEPVHQKASRAGSNLTPYAYASSILALHFIERGYAFGGKLLVLIKNSSPTTVREKDLISTNNKVTAH
jgi:hypothetical protein